VGGWWDFGKQWLSITDVENRRYAVAPAAAPQQPFESVLVCGRAPTVRPLR
jgi:hypothetical protein